MKKRNTILVDIDHTISNAFWRDDMVAAKDWDAYHSASINDHVIRDIADLVLSWRSQYDGAGAAIAFTARPEKFRQLTNCWLLRENVFFDEMLMRPDEAFRPASEIKMELALARFGSEDAIRDQVAFVMDDREDVLQAFRAIGVTALQVFARQK